MKPQPQNYTVHEVEGGYQVHTTYDLMHMNKPYPCGPIFKTADDAFCRCKMIYKIDSNNYKVAKARGRSWPEND